MELFETVIVVFTFLLLNIPVFYSLYRYLFRELNVMAKAIICILYWFFAFLTNELVPFIGIVILLIKVHSREKRNILVRDTDIWHIDIRDSGIVAGAALVFKLAISQLNRIYVNLLSSYLGMQVEPQEIVKKFEVEKVDSKILLFALVVILAPFVEEYIFRYYLYDKLLLPRMPGPVAAIISSALFTLLHLNVSGIPTFFGLGLYCTYIYEKKGFYGAVITHLVSNLTTAVLLM